MAKRLFCCLMALVVLLSLGCIFAFASASDRNETAMADALNALGLFRGRNDGYALDKSLTRAEAVTMITRFLGAEDEALATEYELPFIDMPEWAVPYIGYAYTNKITNGTGEDIFSPDDKIPQNQFVTLVLRLLGYDDAKGDFDYRTPYALAVSVGLVDEDYAPDSFDRGDMVRICYNALEAEYKNSSITVSDKLISDGVFTRREYNSAVGSVPSYTTGGSWPDVPDPAVPPQTQPPKPTTTPPPTTTTTAKPVTTPTPTTPEVTTPALSVGNGNGDNFVNDPFA